MAWSAEQISNAKIIINVGRQLGASDRDIMIALMAANQESNLRNLNYGDRDSIGMFQQRNAWGSRADRLDPVKSTRMFFLGGAQGQRGLLDFKNRDRYGLGQMAQKVQVSAFPNAYAKWEDESASLLKELGGGGGKPTGVITPPETGYDETERTIVPEYTSDAQEQASTALSALGADSPTSAGTEAAGAGAASSPGAESADQQPELTEFPQLDELQFLPASTGEPGGVAGSFEDLFPKGQTGSARQRVVDIARTGLGIEYVWGGNNLRTGVDCSGLVQQAYKQMGIDLPRISAAQARAGKRIGLGQLQVGDLVAWDNSSRNNGADHIAIYIGNGQIIEAPRTGLSVRIRSLGASDRREAWGVDMSQYF
jgi:cell wall-associated NlpC family hydrolase